MVAKVAINGFGRIGRMFLRAALTKSDLEVVAVNDITDATTLAHLLKYDSIHGQLKHDVKVEGSSILLDGKPLQVIAEQLSARGPDGDAVIIAIANLAVISVRSNFEYRAE